MISTVGSVPHEQATRVLYSDIDGTFAHYLPTTSTDDGRKLCGEEFTLEQEADDSEFSGTYCCYHSQNPNQPARVMPLPLSSTGKRAWISLPALRTASVIRSFRVPLVLVTGARTSTSFQRLAYLPAADAIATENGGRLFHRDGSWQTGVPVREDLVWRARHDAACGPASQEALPAAERCGPLWDVYRTMCAAGFKIDTDSYSTCFRVKNGSKTQEELQEQLDNLPKGLTSTVNLGKADVYPDTSGKARVAEYYAEFCGVPLSKSAFMCDDDNDIALARLVGKAYCPSISSESLEKAVKSDPTHFGVAERGFTFGTEDALQLLCDDWGIKNVPASLPSAPGGPDAQAQRAYNEQAPHRCLDLDAVAAEATKAVA